MPSPTPEPRDEAEIMADCADLRARLDADEISTTKADTLGKLLSIELRARRSWVEQHKLEIAKRLLDDLKKSMRK